MHVVILDLHPLSLGLALHPVPVVAPYLHLVGNVLENILVAVSFVDSVLGLLITQDGNKLCDWNWVEEDVMSSSMVCGGLRIHR